MKEFPPEEVLSFLIGLRVANVIFQPYSVDITFDDDTIIIVEHLLEHLDGSGGQEVLDIQNGFSAVALHKVVDRRVASIKRKPFLLVLLFEDSQVLRIISRPGPLESGHITHNGDIVVF